MQWFRMYTKFATDLMVQSLAFEDQRHFVILLCLKADGTLDRAIPKANRDRLIYRGLGLDPHAAEEAKKRLIESQLIDKNWQPRSWNKLQFKTDDSTPRVRNYRKNKETGNGEGPLQKQQSNVAVTPSETDTETETDPTPTRGVVAQAPKGASAENCPAVEIISLYHRTLPTAPRIEKLTPARRAQIRARWQDGNQDLDGWRRFFEYVAESDFLMGRCPPRNGSALPFQADLEWLTRAGNWAKVIEGRYHRG